MLSVWPKQMFRAIAAEQFVLRALIKSITVFHNAAPGKRIIDFTNTLFVSSENKLHAAIPYNTPFNNTVVINSGIPVQLSAPAADKDVITIAAAVRKYMICRKSD